MRGTFANIRLKNLIGGRDDLVGGLTVMADGDVLPIYDAAMKYAEQGTPLVVLAGKEYGSGSSRDWAAKGTTPAGRQGRDRRVLRAHPPLQPGRAWACSRCSSPTGSRRSRSG